MISTKFSRRTALKSVAGGTAAVGAALTLPARGHAAEGKVKGNIRHSVCKWCYGSTGLEKLAAKAASLGMESVELLDPSDFPTMRKHGLMCAMVSFPTGTLKDGKTRVGGIGKAFNRLEHHDTLVEVYGQRIKETANAGLKNLICFSGNRDGMDDETGLKNCAIGIKRILLAGIAGVSLIVGGIGIMNIMLVSVTERTREIGVRKALGATRRAIMIQFLVEALFLCVLGGLLGVVVGYGAAELMTRVAEWETVVAPQAVAVALAFSAGIGLFFGIWPARRASMLDPIDALRYE